MCQDPSRYLGDPHICEQVIGLTPLLQHAGHEHSVSSVCFTASGDVLISASRDKTIKLWEVATGFNTRTLSGHADWVRKARLSGDGHWLASVGNDQSIRVWQWGGAHDTRHDLRVHTHVVECVDWAPPSATAAIAEMAGASTVGCGFFANFFQFNNVSLRIAAYWAVFRHRLS